MAANDGQRLKIRAAHADDAPAIAELHVRAWQFAYAHLLPAEFLDAMSVAERTQRWRGVLAGAESTTAEAQQDGTVIAFVNYGGCRDAGTPAGRGEVWALYAAPEAWGRGAGRALLAHAVDALAAGGYLETARWVFSDYARARRFYAAAGFTPVAGSAQRLATGGVSVEELQYLLRQPAQAGPAAP